MVRRVALLGSLAALVLTTPAPGHERYGSFPTLKAAAGGGSGAQKVERRVRRIETSLIGRAHAAQHARQRAAGRQAADAPRERLTPDNDLVRADRGGQWSAGIPLPIVAINATLMHTGKVLIFAYPWRPGRPDPDTGATLVDSGRADAYVFDPVTGRSRFVPPPIDPDTGKPANIFCAGTSTLPDGRVLVVGGNVGDPTATQNQGLNTVFSFDPASESWQTHERTRQGRWYPSQLSMADGRTLILGGIPKRGDPDWAPPTEYRLNADVEIFDPATGDVDRIENFRADERDGHPPLPGQYPHLFWMPGGHALVAGPRTSDTWSFVPPATGVEDAEWTDLPDLPIHREWAPAVLFAGTSRVMLFGGANRDDHAASGYYPANGSTTSFDDEQPWNGWRDGADMRVERAFHNAVQMPDGRVAIIGGGFGEDPSQEHYRWGFRDAQRRAEIYDPAADTFTLGNAQAEGRTYHSTALLLPDGRVMSSGDDINGPTGPDSGVRTDTAEIWSPPYLYEDRCEARDRPVLRSAPAAIAYGSTFTAGVRGGVARAVLVAPGADTHNTDMSQRVVELDPPIRIADTVSLRAPANPDLAPPGFYMLFVLDGRGTPSVARFVHLGGAEPGLAADVAPTPAAEACDPLALRLRTARVTPSGRLSVRVKVTRSATVKVTASGATRARTVRLTRGQARRVTLRLRRRVLERPRTQVRAMARPRSGPKARATLRVRLPR